MSDDNEGIADPCDDQDHRQDVHWHVVSSMVAELIGDRESHSGQHEMRQDFHASFGEHEIGKYNAYEAYDANEIIDGLHSVRPTFSAERNYQSAVPSPHHEAKT
jgi:hypothetical protein